MQSCYSANHFAIYSYSKGEIKTDIWFLMPFGKSEKIINF